VDNTYEEKVGMNLITELTPLKATPGDSLQEESYYQGRPVCQITTTINVEDDQESAMFNATTDTTAAALHQHKSTSLFVEGSLFRFLPSRQLSQLLVYNSPDLAQRYIGAIREQTLIMVLERKGLFSLINVRGLEGWIHLSPQFLENTSIFAPISVMTANPQCLFATPVDGANQSLYCQVINRTAASPQTGAYYWRFEDWHGKNTFLCQGRLMIGKDDKFFYSLCLGMVAILFPFLSLIIPQLPHAMAWTVGSDSVCCFC
jgi:hypothetical protein